MLLVFERLILPTHASCHVQFIMFYLCNTKLVSNDIILSCFKCLLFWLSPFYFGKGQYLKWLKSKILNPNFPYMYVTYTVDYQYIILLNYRYGLCWWQIFNSLMGSLLSPRISLQTSIQLIRVASAQSTLFAAHLWRLYWLLVEESPGPEHRACVSAGRCGLHWKSSLQGHVYPHQVRLCNLHTAKINYVPIGSSQPK